MTSLKDRLAALRRKDFPPNAIVMDIHETPTPIDNNIIVPAVIPERKEVKDETPIEHKRILQKIHDLSTVEGESLKNEMDNLKKALKENPTAVSLMLPADIGMLVAALYKITGRAIQTANAPKERKPRESKKSKSMTEAELLAAEMEL